MNDPGLVFITTEQNTCYCKQISDVKESVEENGVINERRLLQLLGPSQSITAPTSAVNFKSLNISHSKLKSVDASLSLLTNLCELDVSGNELVSLPDSFCMFRKLHTVDLSSNRFLEVPDCILRLDFIINLNLSHNPISNFDESPKCLSFLKRLTMTHTKLETLPKWLFTDSCVKLELLNLSYNLCFHKPLNDDVLYRFKHSSSIFSKSLKKLDFSNCSAAPKNLDIISHFDVLQCLNIGNENSNTVTKTKFLNCLWDLPPSLFSNNNQFMSLSSLNISNASLSTLSEDIYLLLSLQEIDASHNELNWLPNNFSQLTNLAILNLSHNRLAMLPADFSNLTSLKELFLGHNQLDRFPANFERLVNLEYVDLYANYLEEYPAEVIKNLTNYCLKGLDFSWNKHSPPLDEHYVELQASFRLSFAKEEIRLDTERPVEQVSDDRSDESFSSCDEDDLPALKVEFTTQDVNRVEDVSWDDDDSLDRFDPNLPNLGSRSSSYRSLCLGAATPPVGYYIRDDIGPVYYPSDRMAFCPSDMHPPSIRAAKKHQKVAQTNFISADVEQFEDP